MLTAPLLAARTSALPPSSLDFHALLPAAWPRSAVFADPDAHLWDPAMVRTADGVCHLLYSTWPKSLGFDAWATHAEIAWATAEKPEGPYRYQRKVLTARGADHWDGHSVYNTCLLSHGGKFYLYYTGNRGSRQWKPDQAPGVNDEAWWAQRNNQRVGVAVADHPGGPWRRFDKPLIDTGPETGQGITAVPNVIARPSGGFLLVYKTLAPGPGRYGGGVVHYPSVADRPLGPFRRHSRILIDKKKLLGASTSFNFHIDDHVEWYEGDRYYGIVKDHDAPFFSAHGRALLLIESADGLDWRLSRHLLVQDFLVRWDQGPPQRFERLEMPKLYREGGRSRMLFLAARPETDPSATSFLLAVPLREASQSQ